MMIYIKRRGSLLRVKHRKLNYVEKQVAAEFFDTLWGVLPSNGYTSQR